MSTLRITRRAADRLRTGHLWVYRTDLEPQQSEAPEPGSLITLTDSRNIPLGTALYSSASQIAARLISRIPALTREQYLADLRLRIDAAIQLRRELAPIVLPDNAAGAPATNAHRLIFSEADNLPGIIADRYNDLILLQLLTQGTAQDDVRHVLVEALREAPRRARSTSSGVQHLTLWERPDPRIRELEQLPPPPPGPLFTTHPPQHGHLGSPQDPHLDSPQSCHLDRSPMASSSDAAERPAASPPTTTTFTLNGLHFHYDAASGQKTGAFLDQRLNYAAATRIVQASGRTKRALDICTYQGGFALHLAQVCAHVTGVDASRAALEAADRNLALNPNLRAEVDWMEADAFDYLRHLDDLARSTNNTVISTGALSERRESKGAVERPAAFSHDNPNFFDAIVLDPPAFAKSKRAAESALRGYKELNLRAIRLLAPGGTLITNSCSHHVSLADFTAIIASAASDANRRVQLLETHAAAPDHPEILTLPETSYLKCLICRVD